MKSKSDKRILWFFGGNGTLVLVYLPLRLLENQGAIYFIILWLSIAFGLGWLLDHDIDSISEKGGG